LMEKDSNGSIGYYHVNNKGLTPKKKKQLKELMGSCKCPISLSLLSMDERYGYKSEFETEDCHLNLDRALEEIIWLYRVYGLEDDKNLTGDAIELKEKILQVVNEIKSI